MTRRATANIEPRLLNDAEAAAYLGIPRTRVKHLPRGKVMINGRPRWDRFALDQWVDEMQGAVAVSPANPGPTDDADAALDRWLASHPGHDAGRP